MIKLIDKTLLLSTVLVLSGCASIDFYEVKEDGTEKETGFLYYPPKPYLLIETKDDNLTTKIISLPDLSRPHRVKQDNGWGSAELSFNIENGMIKSFNSKTDSKAPETLTSIAGLVSAKAELITAQAKESFVELISSKTFMTMTLKGVKSELPVDYKVKVFEDSHISIKDNVIPALEKEKSEFKNEIVTLKKVQASLKKNTSIVYKSLSPDAFLAAVEEKRKLATKLATKLKNVSTTLDIYAKNMAEKPNLVLLAKNANTPLKQVIKSVLEFSLRSSSVAGLYEIDYINGRLNLRKVVLD